MKKHEGAVIIEGVDLIGDNARFQIPIGYLKEFEKDIRRIRKIAEKKRIKHYDPDLICLDFEFVNGTELQYELTDDGNRL